MSGAAKDEANTEKRNNKIIPVIIAALAVVVIALGAAVVILLGRGSGAENGNAAARDVAGSVRTVVDTASGQDVMDQMREEVAEGMFECQMSMTWTFENGTAASQNSYVANSTNNTHPICFDVYLQDTEELIYSSPVLPVGTQVTGIQLDRELPAGEYSATVMYKILQDVETQEEISEAGFVVTILVLS